MDVSINACKIYPYLNIYIKKISLEVSSIDKPYPLVLYELFCIM